MNQDKALKNCAGTIYLPGGGWVFRDRDLEAEHDGREPDSDREPETEL